jgi:hypothetical protein
MNLSKKIQRRLVSQGRAHCLFTGKFADAFESDGWRKALFRDE